MSKIIGIDLGTTNSCVSILENGQPKILINKAGCLTTPSTVAYLDNGDVLVGETAKNQKLNNVHNTFYSIKRLIGKHFNEETVQQDKQDLPFEIVKVKNGDVWAKVTNKTNNTEVLKSPQQISAEIIIYLKEAAEEYLHEKVTKAIITVPAYFNDIQRKATEDAVKIAGLEPVRIINEPTAAALAYGFTKQINEKKNIVIYDLGGGTFDVSVINVNTENHETVVDILATNGDSHLGGDDFDKRISDYIIDDFEKQSGINLRDDKLALCRIKEEAEKAKKSLSSVIEVDITIPFLFEKHHYINKLLRNDFEYLVKDLIDRTIQTLKLALADAKLSIENIDEVVLVGGQTRMPAVEKAVEEFFNKKPRKDINPDEVVSLGAGTLCGVLDGEITDVVLADVVPFSLGTTGKNGEFVKLISKNSPIPIEIHQVFTTVENNQFFIEIDVLQGEDKIAANNEKIGTFNITIEKALAGVPEIEVIFSVDINGIIRVHAKDKKTGIEQGIEIKSKSGLSEVEVKQMFKDLRLSRQAQAERYKITKLKNESVIFITELRKMLTIPEFKESPQTDVHKLEQLMNNLEDAFKSNDSQIIENSFIALTEAFMKSIIKS